MIHYTLHRVLHRVCRHPHVHGIKMATAAAADHTAGPATPFQSPTFEEDVRINVKEDFTAASISPSGRDVVLAG